MWIDYDPLMTSLICSFKVTSGKSPTLLLVRQYGIFFFFFFFISNKDSLILKREGHSSTQGVYRGEHQKQTLQKSCKSKIEEKEWFLHTENQSNKV